MMAGASDAGLQQQVDQSKILFQTQDEFSDGPAATLVTFNNRDLWIALGCCTEAPQIRKMLIRKQPVAPVTPGIFVPSGQTEPHVYQQLLFEEIYRAAVTGNHSEITPQLAAMMGPVRAQWLESCITTMVVERPCSNDGGTLPPFSVIVNAALV
jgi:hypothetical protein